MFDEYKKSGDYKSIIKEFKLAEKEMSLFNSFVKYLFRDMLKQNEKYIFEYDKKLVCLLGDVFTSKKNQVVSKYFVGGIICGKQPVCIDYQGFKIRICRASASEYKNYRKKYNLPAVDFSSIIEFQTEYPKERSQFEDVIIQILRLYRVGSVTVSGIETSYYFDFSQKGSREVTYYDKAHFKYLISIKDNKNIYSVINSLFDKIEKVLAIKVPESLTKEERKDFIRKNNTEFSLKIAIDRYNEALLNPRSNIYIRIMYIIMGLEALFNTDEDRETIGFKLKFRASKVIGLLGFDSVKVGSNISKGYGIRSKFAHGCVTEQKIKKELEIELIEYLRISICFFLYYPETKDSLVFDLNRSAYSNDADEIVSKKIEQIKKCI